MEVSVPIYYVCRRHDACVFRLKLRPVECSGKGCVQGEINILVEQAYQTRALVNGPNLIFSIDLSVVCSTSCTTQKGLDVSETRRSVALDENPNPSGRRATSDPPMTARLGRIGIGPTRLTLQNKTKKTRNPP